jgi:hypothetical protein
MGGALKRIGARLAAPQVGRIDFVRGVCFQRVVAIPVWIERARIPLSEMSVSLIFRAAAD